MDIRKACLSESSNLKLIENDRVLQHCGRYCSFKTTLCSLGFLLISILGKFMFNDPIYYGGLRKKQFGNALAQIRYLLIANQRLLLTIADSKFSELIQLACLAH
jgi:hypothetical protein